MFSAMTKTYKVGKLVENIIEKINKSDDFDVELNVVDDNTITVSIKKLRIEEIPEMKSITIRR